VTVRRLGILLAAALAAGGLLLSAGCASPAPAAPAAAPSTLAFTGTTLDGAAFDASTMAGKPAILWFWAPWCATCAAEAQSINDLKDSYGDRLAILGIAGMGAIKDMRQFVSDLQVTGVPNLDDGKGVLWKRFGITEQSTYVLVDSTGRIVQTSYLDDLQLTAGVKALVA
jgi:thiol-disulfide isomerase/thioredoxin